MADGKINESQVRCLSLKESAAYIGVSPRTFQNMVKNKEAPAPIRITKTRVVWDRKQLDELIDALAGF